MDVKKASREGARFGPRTGAQLNGGRLHADAIDDPRFNKMLLGGFAVIALVFSAIGIYGVTASAVARRISEIGMRMALGARPSDIFRSILAPGFRLAAMGAVAGLGGAMLLARLLGGVVFGVNAYQPLVYVATTLLVSAIAAAATVLPARRAMRIDPVAALHQVDGLHTALFTMRSWR